MPKNLGDSNSDRKRTKVGAWIRNILIALGLATVSATTAVVVSKPDKEDPVVVEAPPVVTTVTPVVPTTTTTTTTVTSTSTDACATESATYCAELNGKCGTWVGSTCETWCKAQNYTSAAIDPCVNSKYAHDSCIEDAIADGKAVSIACSDYMATLNDASAEMVAACSKYAAKGQVCEGVKASPGTSPLADCLVANFSALDKTCQDAVTVHENARKTSGR